MSSQEHAGVMAVLFVLAVLTALALWRPVVRSTGWPSVATLLFLLSAAVCVALTLPDQFAPGAFGRLQSCVGWPGAPASVRHLDTGPSHQVVNVLLWVPLGLTGLLATRRPVAVAAGASATWALVELVQTIDPVRMCSPVDWFSNTCGALTGVLLGWAVLRRRGPATA